MKCIRILIVLMAIMFGQGVMFAQEGGQTEDTHAHSESHKWKGIDVTTVLKNPEYATNGKEIYLFNIGTGRFIIEGGNFGMEGRLFHEDFGRPMYLLSNSFIKSGITEKSDEKSWFGCNASGAFHSGSWTDWNKYSFTIMMDARKSYRKGWNFERVEDPSNTDTYTYYMYETSTQNGYKNNKYYLGAAWGECWAKDKNGNPAWKGNGTLVFMDDDRAAWTTINPKGVQDKYLVNDEMITLDELYQWRVVSKEQFYSVLEEEVTGLNPSIAALIPDRDFVRNADNFDTNWVTETKDYFNYSEEGRWGYTFGIYSGKKYQNNSTYPNEAWNKPLRLKNVFENDNDLNYGWENAKYGFLTFEGVGRTYTEFEVPQPGWYMVQCYGLIQSDNNDAYIFARVKGSEINGIEGGESKNNLVRVPSGTFQSKDTKANCLAVGKVLTRPDMDKESYKNTVWILVTEEQFPADGSKPVLQVGVGKDAANKSTNKKNNCYYDTDWVCVDDFRASYLGLGPCFFYEEEENLDYLLFDEEHIKKQYQSAVPNGRYSGATCLERTFKKNKWNSFSFPLPLTGEQVRYAFGEDAALAKIHSVGKMSKNPNVIDFKTVSLFTTNVVVEPGHFYLLKPTKEPTAGIDPQERETTYYELGRMFFSVNENEPAEYTHDKMSVNEVIKTDKQEIESLQNLHDGFAGVNYVQTPNYSGFRVSNGIYTGTEANGIYAPKGSYVVSTNPETQESTIVHLNKDTRLKGFRGWINLNNAIDSQSKDFTMEIFGMFDEEPEQGGTTSVPRIHLFTADESVYDLYGRKVGKLGDTLPKGIYIVKGKKYMVK